MVPKFTASFIVIISILVIYGESGAPPEVRSTSTTTKSQSTSTGTKGTLKRNVTQVIKNNKVHKNGYVYAVMAQNKETGTYKILIGKAGHQNWALKSFSGPSDFTLSKAAKDQYVVDMKGKRFKTIQPLVGSRIPLIDPNDTKMIDMLSKNTFTLEPKDEGDLSQSEGPEEGEAKLSGNLRATDSDANHAEPHSSLETVSGKLEIQSHVDESQLLNIKHPFSITDHPNGRLPESFESKLQEVGENNRKLSEEVNDLQRQLEEEKTAHGVTKQWEARAASLNKILQDSQVHLNKHMDGFENEKSGHQATKTAMQDILHRVNKVVDPKANPTVLPVEVSIIVKEIHSRIDIIEEKLREQQIELKRLQTELGVSLDDQAVNLHNKFMKQYEDIEARTKAQREADDEEKRRLEKELAETKKRLKGLGSIKSPSFPAQMFGSGSGAPNDTKQASMIPRVLSTVRRSSTMASSSDTIQPPT